MANAERWKKVEVLFHETLRLDPGDRAAFLDAQCDDPEARAEIDRLLLHDDASCGLLDWAASRPEVHDPGDPVARPGARIGRYKLIEPIASGGMGTVWKGLRVDGEFVRTVAVKLIKRGMDTDDILHRFRHERQLLANLQHPNIARLFDGGATVDGRPYIVMEHFDGVPIDEYCGDRRLGLRDRLRLFQLVCTAVHQAHKNLIVHRDLKPSNILVTAEGDPKLLDFGIAKVLDPGGAAQTLTATGLRVLTPQYASPEQIKGETITTSSDVYSLGIILYELLTGSRPYDVETVSRHEIERLVLEREPTRPSLAVAQNSRQQSLRTRYAPPEVNARRLRRRLSGDLDTIVMTALRKDPGRRYASAEELASDIARHLRSDPITARADSWVYRSRKFVRRNKVPVAAAVALVLMLVAAVAVSAGFAYEASRALEVAESINVFLNEDLLSSIDPARTTNPDLTVRQALDRAATAIEGRFDGKPIVEASIRRTIGDAYRSLGLPRDAIPHLRRATELYGMTVGRLDEKSRDAMRSWADALLLDGQQEEAARVSTELLELEIRAVGAFSADAMATRHILAQTGALGSDADPGAYLREVLDWNTANLGEAHPETLSVAHTLANIYIYDRRYQEAEPILDRVWRAAHETYGEAHPETLMAMLGRAVLYGRTDRIEQAIELLEECVRLQRETKSDDYTDMGITLVHLGNHLEHTDRRKAMDAYLEGWEVLNRSLGPDNGWTYGLIPNIIRLYDEFGEPERADAWRETLEKAKAANGEVEADISGRD